SADPGRPVPARRLLRRRRGGRPRSRRDHRHGRDAHGPDPGSAPWPVQHGRTAGRASGANAPAPPHGPELPPPRLRSAPSLPEPEKARCRRRVARRGLAGGHGGDLGGPLLPGTPRERAGGGHVAEPRRGDPDRCLRRAGRPGSPGGRVHRHRRSPGRAAGRVARALARLPRPRADLRHSWPRGLASPARHRKPHPPSSRGGGRVMRLAEAPWAAMRTFIHLGARVAERPARPFLPLDAMRLVDAARRRAEARDVADTSFLDGLRVLVGSLETEARLNLVGRITVREDITRLLANRFRIERDRQRDAGIAAEEIRRPIFITGMPRSGSTLLHGLLAQDPASRVPQTWEMLNPSPAPERATYDSDPRIARVERELRWFKRLTPDFQVIHDVGARLPEECTIIIAHSFVSSQFASMYDVPTYSRWCDTQDPRARYEWHRRFLQHLQRRFRAERWVLKAPVH